MPAFDFNILGKLSPESFLKNYWQKKPCLIRQALPGFQCPVTPEELAGYACEEGISARLVMEKGGEHPWQVKYSPLTEADFAQLPESHWTLLVQEVDHLHQEIAALLDYFCFIPNWRIDDVMISYAVKDGSVGPHLDSYDVFLLQGQGKRRWQINPDDYDETDFAPGLDLRIIENFQAREEWILEPGDMLYLPPGIAHHGIAIEPCLTLSIGFLAPTQSELVSHFIDGNIAGTCHDRRYTDPRLNIQEFPGEITKKSLASIRKLMRTTLADDNLLDHWFGRYITTTANPAESENLKSLDVTGFEHLFKKHEIIYRSGDCRTAFIQDENGITLFVNGADFKLEKTELALAALITERSFIHINELSDLENKDKLVKLLCNFYQQGIYYFDE